MNEGGWQVARCPFSSHAGPAATLSGGLQCADSNEWAARTAGRALCFSLACLRSRRMRERAAAVCGDRAKATLCSRARKTTRCHIPVKRSEQSFRWTSPPTNCPPTQKHTVPPFSGAPCPTWEAVGAIVPVAPAPDVQHAAGGAAHNLGAGQGAKRGLIQCSKEVCRKRAGRARSDQALTAAAALSAFSSGRRASTLQQPSAGYLHRHHISTATPHQHSPPHQRNPPPTHLLAVLHHRHRQQLVVGIALTLGNHLHRQVGVG